LFPKDWIPGQLTPPNRYALWRGPRLARDDAVYSLVDFVLGLLFTIPPFHLSTFKYPADPVDPVIRVLLFAQRMKRKTPAALRGFMLVGG